MAVGFLLIGLALIVAAYRNTQHALFSQIASDAPGFAKWAIAIVVIGLLQYIPNFAVAAKYLLALVLLVIVIVNKGAFANFQTAATGTPATVQGGATPALTGSATVDLVGGSGTSNTGSAVASGIGTALQAIPLIGGLF